MSFAFVCAGWFVGYFLLRFGMVSRGNMCQVIQFIGGLLCTAVLISSFFFVGWLKALLGLAVFSFVITPIVEIIIGRIGAAINIPYQKV